MNWLHELIGTISKFEASQEERVALVALANRLSVAANELEVQVPKPWVVRSNTMPVLEFVRATRSYRMDLVFCIEDPASLDCVCVVEYFTPGNTLIDRHEFRNPNLRERLRTFFAYDK